MIKPRVMILHAPGTNCDEETKYCFEIAGAAPHRVLVNDLLSGNEDYMDYQILAIPGGFSYGDCIAAGRILATYLATRLADLLREFSQKDKLILGICNGCQVLARCGLFDTQYGATTLEQNESHKFECRWVRLVVPQSTQTPFLEGIERMWLPVAHAEGRFVVENQSCLTRFRENGQIAMQYAAHAEEDTVCYPDNPNGSVGDVAGLLSENKRVLGMMPHPERFHAAHHMFHKWDDESQGSQVPSGSRIFQNIVEHFG